MSGGQMQRVAIARALVNNPDILLADEPTGALDSETSLQIMELLKEIAHDRLVIMVTHNPKLAAKYSTRTINLLDGRVIDDSDPYSSEPSITEKIKKVKRKKISMSFLTALQLSFKNLMTKKKRTLLTAFAGSIGIIGIALILSLSNGMQGYIANIERDTLASFPLEIHQQSMDMSGMMGLMMGARGGSDVTEHDPDMVYANQIMTNMMVSMSEQIHRNDLAAFMRHIESENSRFRDYASIIQYRYNVELQIFNPTENGVTQVNPSAFMEQLEGGMGGGGMSMGGGMEIWTELLDNQDLLDAQYDLVAGKWATEHDELVLIIGNDNQISDVELYALGLLDPAEFDELMTALMRGEEIERREETLRFTHDELLALTFRVLLNTDYYEFNGEHWFDVRDDEERADAFLVELIENALELRVVGIVRPSDNVMGTAMSGTVGYTAALLDYIIHANADSEIAQAQQADPETNVFTGMPFDIEAFLEDFTLETFHAMMSAEMAEMTVEEQMQATAALAEMQGDMTDEEFLEMMKDRIREAPPMSFEQNLETLGIVDPDNPSTIRLFPLDFAAKQALENLIAEYNAEHEAAGNEQYTIHFTDFVGMMTSGIADIINIVSYVLIAFVSISLIVSSIMIAIITYISVLERTKEIGILRSIGASKKDITRVFNAETVIEGFVAGTMGILITLLLNIPANALIHSLTGISGLSALPILGAVGLIAISVVLTVIAGFIPSKLAAKKDPVVALRME
jgi:putative ABC transport system permease protein